MAAAEWALAGGASLVLNSLAFLAFAVVLGIEKVELRELAPKRRDEAVALILPEMLKAERAAAEPDARGRRPFARTSADQQAGKSERARFLGERDTVAASERDPVAGAVELPSQAGREPRHEGEIETTRSDYQDGDLAHNQPAPRTPADTPAPAAATPAEPAAPPEAARHEATPPGPADPPDPLEPAPEARPPERLAVGPDPVDRPLPPEPRQPPGQQSQPPERASAEDESARPPAPDAARQRDPGFRGNQQKTRLRGSISRRGNSSLDVDNTPLGRYQAALSRAVEREWQRNCVRYRDFITPGFLTVRFLVESDGRVRRLEFLEVVEAGEIQKGFTLNSIRGAPIPPMPAALRRELDGDPLELIYNFYF